MNKQKYAEQFGRWIEENEIVIEDLEELDLLNLGEKLSEAGYKCEYWKAENQRSGHLHLKDFQFERCPERLTINQLNEFKRLFMLKHIPKELHDQVDWSFVKTKRHRIAEENKQHFKQGYGVKKLIKIFGENNENRVEKDLYFKAKEIETKERVYDINPNAPKIQEKVNITDIASKMYGLKLKNNKTICPFHADKDPSLVFNNSKGSFYCFGCHVKGGIIKFVQMMEDLKNGNK